MLMVDQLDVTYPNQELEVLEDKEEVTEEETVDLAEDVVAVVVVVVLIQIELLKKEISMDLLVKEKCFDNDIFFV